MRAGRLRGALVAAFALAAFPALAQHGHRPETAKAEAFDEAKALAASQGVIGQVVSADHAFRNTRGETVKLSAYRGRPVVLSLIYTSCDHTCPLIAESIMRAVEAADATLDRRGYSVLTVGFDTKVDTPPRMRLYQSSRGLTRPGWDFLSADAPTIERLAAETGFYYTPRAGGFDHLAQVTLIDGDGRIYRQVYGDSFPAAALVEPLTQLVYDQREDSSLVSSMLNRVRLLCTVYDPASGRYEFSYAILFEMIIGGVSLAAVLVFAIRLWRQTRAA
jgi:protein SCO1/2